MEGLDTRSLAVRAYARLLHAIVWGELEPGERLSDAELARELGTSRTPVREALLRLESDGLVEIAPRAGTRVAAVDIEGAAQAFTVVAALHALATRLGTGALSEADLAEMEQADRDQAPALARGDVVAAIEADDRVHAVLLRAAGNAELTATIERLMPKIRRADVRYFTRLVGSGAAGRHADLIAACRRGDATVAAALVEASYLAIGAEVADAAALG